MDQKISCTFTSGKINCIEFVDNNVFVSGTTDNRPNRLTLWRLESSAVRSIDSETSPDDNENSGSPQRLYSHDIYGDICDIKSIGEVTAHNSSSHPRYVCASSSGCIYQGSLHHQTCEVASRLASPCTCLAVSHTLDVVCFSSDCSLAIFRLDRPGEPNKVTVDAESSIVNACQFLTPCTLVSGNSAGQLKVWDLRAASVKPIKIILMSQDRCSINCLATQRDQPDLLACGGSDGCLALWDLRREDCPVQLHEGHASNVWGIQFHPEMTDHIFTCSEDGQLFHWSKDSYGNTQNEALLNTASSFTPRSLLPSVCSMPINCLAVSPTISRGAFMLCAGTDNEAIFTVTSEL